jgi:Ala-tRNA(Pro) deacylase
MDAGTLTRPYAPLLDWLRGQHVDFEVHEHPEAFTAASTARAEGVDARTFAKVVGVGTDDGRQALLVVDAPDRVDLRKARSILRAEEVWLLSEDELTTLAPGCEPGALPAVGALFAISTLADYAVEDDPEISFNAGTHRHTVRVDRFDWERATRVRYADRAADPEISAGCTR